MLFEHFLVVTEFVKFPHMAVVVTVVDLGVPEVCLRELVTLAPGFCHVGQSQAGDLFSAGIASRQNLMESSDEVVEVCILIAMGRRLGWLQQGARQHGQAMAQTGGVCSIAVALLRNGMQRRPDPAQTRVLTHGKRFHPRILEKLDRHALKRAVVVGKDGAAPAPVGGHVSQHRAVAVQPADAMPVVIHIRQADAQRVIVGDGFAQFVERRGVRHQIVCVLPQAKQVQIELAGVVHQQRAVPLALQHGTAVGRLQAEVIALALRVLVVVAYAVLNPVAQALNRQLAQQMGRLQKKIRQTGTGIGLVDTVYRA